MPRIKDHLLECVVFLYPSADAARAGEHYGGSGFLVALVSPSGVPHPYVVTNRHVVHDGATHIRLNTDDGRSDVMSTELAHWHLSDDADVAIYPLLLAEPKRGFHLNAPMVRADKFMNHVRIAAKGIGAGEDTFIVGRFVGYDGKQKNKPTVRFGALSMMADPNEGVYNSYFGRDVEAFLVETHTVCGYSGSPVFLHIDPDHKRPESDKSPSTKWRGPWLLGIDTANILEGREVQRLDAKSGDWVDESDRRTLQSTGMIAVTPAWHIYNLLHDVSVISEREGIEAAVKKMSKPIVQLKTASPAADTDAQFERTVKAMLSTPPQPKTAKRTPAKKAKKC